MPNGNLAGSFGDISCFSFYYAHHISTIEGGMICTNDDHIYQVTCENPDRFIGLGTIPMHNIDLAILEIEAFLCVKILIDTLIIDLDI